jgi:hypothetical protein
MAKYSIKVKEEKNILDQRIKNYKLNDKLLQKLDISKKCSLKPFSYHRIGSKSRYGIVYELSFIEKTDAVPIVVKVMDKSSEKNISESVYYETFKHLVLKKQSPHFPLTWEGSICNDQCSFIDPDMFEDEISKRKWEKIKQNRCFLIFSELFEGDLVSYALSIRSLKTSEKIPLFCSMIFQVMLALYSLYSYGLSHNDLHTQNVLYYTNRSDKKNKKYLKYKVKNEKESYYLEVYDHIFVLWDFGKVSKIGDRSPYSEKHLAERDFPIFKPLSSIYWDMCIFIDALSYFIYKAKLEKNNVKNFIKELRKNYVACAMEFSKASLHGSSQSSHSSSYPSLPTWNKLMSKMIELSVEFFGDSVITKGEDKEKNKFIQQIFRL